VNKVCASALKDKHLRNGKFQPRKVCTDVKSLMYMIHSHSCQQCFSISHWWHCVIASWCTILKMGTGGKMLIWCPRFESDFLNYWSGRIPGATQSRMGSWIWGSKGRTNTSHENSRSISFSISRFRNFTVKFKDILHPPLLIRRPLDLHHCFQDIHKLVLRFVIVFG
jgi:hypothetical protein